jgi:hypothetical protein
VRGAKPSKLVGQVGVGGDRVVVVDLEGVRCLWWRAVVDALSADPAASVDGLAAGAEFALDSAFEISIG